MPHAKYGRDPLANMANHKEQKKDRFSLVYKIHTLYAHICGEMPVVTNYNRAHQLYKNISVISFSGDIQ